MLLCCCCCAVVVVLLMSCCCAAVVELKLCRCCAVVVLSSRCCCAALPLLCCRCCCAGVSARDSPRGGNGPPNPWRVPGCRSALAFPAPPRAEFSSSTSCKACGGNPSARSSAKAIHKSYPAPAPPSAVMLPMGSRGDRVPSSLWSGDADLKRWPAGRCQTGLHHLFGRAKDGLAG